MSEAIQKAMRMAMRAHARQFDKAGDPCIYHVVRVAAVVSGAQAKTVALLHDIVEDTHVTLESLKPEFQPQIVDAVDALTRRGDETYAQYILRVKDNPLGRAVKLADIEDHLGPGHEKVIPASLVKRYVRARFVLEGWLE